MDTGAATTATPRQPLTAAAFVRLLALPGFWRGRIATRGVFLGMAADDLERKGHETAIAVYAEHLSVTDADRVAVGV